MQLGHIVLPRKRCDILSGCQSVHLNIQVPATLDAIQMLNKSIELVPYLVALGAHAALVNCQPSGFREFRTPLWKPLFTFPNIDTQHGVNTQRTGLPDRYYTGWDDYWQDVATKLFFTLDIERALESNMKNFWRIARLKPCPGSRRDVLLELRALSTQPTLEEDAAFNLLIVALLHDTDWCSRPLLPLEYVRANLALASSHGIDTNLYTLDNSGHVVQQSASTIITALLDRADDFWRDTSDDATELFDLLYARLALQAGSPAQMSLRQFEQDQVSGDTAEGAARRVMMAHMIPATVQRSL
jgi:gamma-glutamyl:cysteine ligase YbdK (ATP-grasp superfamily)